MGDWTRNPTAVGRTKQFEKIGWVDEILAFGTTPPGSSSDRLPAHSQVYLFMLVLTHILLCTVLIVYEYELVVRFLH